MLRRYGFDASERGVELVRRGEKAAIPVYILIEICLLIAIKLPERIISGSVQTVLSYLAIVCNSAVMLYFCHTYGRGRFDRHENLVALALYITTVADLLLTYLGMDFAIPGVLCFCVVETVYMFYLNSPPASILARAALFSGLCIGAFATGNVSPLNILALINISVLSVNVFDAWRFVRGDYGLLFKIGITLFFFCDLCVGLSSLLDGTFGSVAGFLIWIFYIPSQVLITLSYVKRCKQI